MRVGPGFGVFWACAAGIAVAVWPGGAGAATVQSIVDAFAWDALGSGQTLGLEIAVVIGGKTPQFFGFGTTTAGKAVQPTQSTDYQIASVTKIFTTAQLALAAAGGSHLLTQHLGGLEAELGRLPADTADVTLQDLADFTGGFPTLPGICAAGATPVSTGCLPNERPTTVQYTAQDLAAFFRTYRTPGAPPNPYVYSDFSIGLLGLLLGAPPGQPLSNTALTSWEKLLSTEILAPLHMTSTAVNLPASLLGRLSPGYTLAQANAVVKDGGVSSISMRNDGAAYTAVPQVSISGGGGTGATARAELSPGGAVTAITVTSPGKDFTAPASLVLTNGGSTKTAALRAIIDGGKVIGVAIDDPGAGYVRTPDISFSGGRAGSGSDATGTVFIAHGQVAFVRIDTPGSGYVDPVVVHVQAPPPSVLNVPIWAPAGALKSSAADLANLAAAAAGSTTSGTLAIPHALSAAFQTAETPYACEGSDPHLAGCTTVESGLAWDVQPQPPAIAGKDGALPGYGSYVLVIRSKQIGVVVLSNAYSNEESVVPRLAEEIGYALYFTGATQ